MAAKTTKKAKTEEPVVAVEEKVEEVVETQAPLEEKAEEAIVEEVAAEPKTEETTVEETVIETKAEEVVENNTADNLEEVQKLAEELYNVDAKVNDAKEVEAQKAMETLSEQLEAVKEIENKLQNETKKTISGLSDKQRKSTIFSNFWCGVSDGWNN